MSQSAENCQNRLLRVGLFGTCRVAALKGEKLHVVKKTKSETTAVPVGLIYEDSHAIYESQPFNYTTKLKDVLDSVKYLKGSFLNGSVSANHDPTFFSLFCRAYGKSCFENKECSEPGSWKNYDWIVAEVNSLRQLIITTNRFGELFRGINLPWNATLESQHQLIDIKLEDVEIVEPTPALVDEMIGELISLIQCPLLIIGPYLLPDMPKERTLWGDEDTIPVDKINARRLKVQSILKDSCHNGLFSYFDMTEAIALNPAMLRDQYHFSELGQEFLYRNIRSIIRAGPPPQTLSSN